MSWSFHHSFDVGAKVGEQLVDPGESISLLTAENVPVIAFASFVVVTQDALSVTTKASR
jgi:hypothetical protein